MYRIASRQVSRMRSARADFPCRVVPPFTFSSRVLFVLHHGVISPLWFVALSLCSGMLLHKKQMPFMVGKGACPFALSRPLVWRSSERSENLDRTSGRIRRRV
jgi:hypothetical protein